MGLFRKKVTDDKYYDAILYQNLMLSSPLLENYVISIAMKTNQHLDPEILLRAVNMEIERNESLLLRFVREKGVWRQHIIAPFTLKKLKTHDMHNRSLSEVESAVDKAASTRLNLRRSDPPFEIIHFIGPENTDYLLLNFLHVHTDGHSSTLTLADIFQIYFHLIGISDMPQPLTSVREFLDNSEQYLAAKAIREERAKKFYIEQYDRLGEPLYTPAKRNAPELRTGRGYTPIPKLHKKSDVFRAHFSPEFYKKCSEFALEHKVELNALFLLAIRTYYSALNDNQDDIYLGVSITNKGKKAEKLLPFFLASSVNLRTVISSDCFFAEALQSMNNSYALSLRYRDYSSLTDFAITAERYKTEMAPYKDLLYGRFSANFSFPDGWTIEGYCPAQKTIMDMTPIYMMVMDAADKGLNFNYQYISEIYDETDIKALHNGFETILRKGMETPDITIGELLKEFE